MNPRTHALQGALAEVVIVGAGPYGLSVAAQLRRRGIPFRIFGRPMDSWVAHMPKGMMLKSDGFASNIGDPDSTLSLKQFCAERGIEYGDTGIPVRLETFTSYGLAFKDRIIPELEDKMVTGIERNGEGFTVRLDDGETIAARRVVLAIGITHFEYVPERLAQLPEQFVSHSARHVEVEPFRGRNVAVIGAGASALDLAGLLQEAGARVQLISRRQALKFHSKPDGRRRSFWDKLRRPQSGLGPGYKSLFFANWPRVFYYLPQQLRLEAVRRALGPSGGWFVRDMVMGKVQLVLGYNIQAAAVRNGQVHLKLRGVDGSVQEVTTEHVIAATGYRVDLQRLSFLSAEIRSQMKSLNRAPVLSSSFESSIPGLYFVGVAAANTFGPVMRFAFGAGFAAGHLSRHLAKKLAHKVPAMSASTVVTEA